MLDGIFNFGDRVVARDFHTKEVRWPIRPGTITKAGWVNSEVLWPSMKSPMRYKRAELRHVTEADAGRLLSQQ